jgi:hypothetical protein
VLSIGVESAAGMKPYLEKNFTILPQEAMGRSLAFDLLHTVRLTMRSVAKYGKVGPGS